VRGASSPIPAGEAISVENPQSLKETAMDANLPKTNAPGGDYVSVIVHGGVAYVSGQLPRRGDELVFKGKVGAESERLSALELQHGQLRDLNPPPTIYKPVSQHSEMLASASFCPIEAETSQIA